MIANKLSAVLAAVLLTLSAPGFAAKTSTSTSTNLTTAEAADLTFMREEEKLARDTYLVLGDTWKLTVFSNIASSEQRHMDAILGLLQKYRLPDPATSTLIGEFSNPELQSLYNALIAKGMQSDLEALMVGGLIEETDMEDIQAAIDRSQHPDVVAVFENLMCGSRNHLRGFAANLEAFTGQPYSAQVLEQGAVDEILATPLENCGE
ncbi:MAG: DUF2202 domain-containing protein [Thiobacillus sp.]|nr:DUF2202 domain-containing protein [Thiobacillus sp.]